MTDKEAVLDTLKRLPTTATIDEIADELRIMTSIRRRHMDIGKGRTKTQEETEALLESWATAWTSR